MDLGRIGLWTHTLDPLPWTQARDVALEIEQLGFGTLWLPEAVNRDAMVHSTLVLGATTDLVVATGIVPLYARDAMTTNASLAHDRRGVSRSVRARPRRQSQADGRVHPQDDVHASARDDAPVPRRHGRVAASSPRSRPRHRVACSPRSDPKMLALSAGARRRRAPVPRDARAHRDGTRDRRARQDPRGRAVGRARAPIPKKLAHVARASLAIYLGLPNYTNNWKRLGFTDADLADGGSDRFVDAVVAWGDDDAIKSRVEQHLAAGAGHVCIQVIPTHGGTPIEEWRRLSAALL